MSDRIQRSGSDATRLVSQLDNALQEVLRCTHSNAVVIVVPQPLET